MTQLPLSKLGAGAFVVAFGFAGFAAYAFGGGRDARRAPPSVAASANVVAKADAPGKGSASIGEEVEVRLTHALDGATIELPELARGEVALAAHWRRMQIPWVSFTPNAKRATTSIALRTSADEKQWAMPKKDGGTWAPDARVWNMNEGSFDQRESIFAPTPATFTFRVTVPPQARLTYAAALVAKSREPVVFRVTARDANEDIGKRAQRAPGPEDEREICTTSITDEQKWSDQSCDLAPFAGKSVELRLRTTGGAPGSPGLALWGNPVIVAKRATEIPYNVLFVVVDALRPDVLASFHEGLDPIAPNATPPLDARLPKVEGLTPVIDDLAKKGVRFTRAWSGGAWTRPGTLSMLGGALSSQIGVDPLPWVVPEPQVTAYYQSDPPLLPLLMRRARVQTRAFVNNYFMVGYAAVGVDMGFERVDDHRYRTRDTMEVTESATRWMRENKDGRFFAFVNYNSPHEPWEPPARFMDRLPPPCKGKTPATPCGPSEDIPRKYMAEAAKDDEAIGVLLKTLDEIGARDRTLVVITADHGETLSAAHTGRSKLDDMNVRFHHAVSNYEETTRIPIVMSLPNVLPAGTIVKAPVSNTDIAPTILELLGRPIPAKMTGRSLVPLVKNPNVGPAERSIVSEGRGTRAILHGPYRLLTREGGARTTTIEGKPVTVAEELYDLASDPGERRDLAAREPQRVAELRARMQAVLKNAVPADAATAQAAKDVGGATPGGGAIELRFVGGAKPRRVTGTVTTEGGTFTVQPLGIAPEAARASGNKVEVAFVTDLDHAVGFRLKVEPESAPVKWSLFFDDKPVDKDRFYGGTFGLAEPALEHGLGSERARVASRATADPEIDAAREVGVFVVRRGAAGEAGEAEAAGEGSVPERATSGAAAAEMSRMLREWGYANRAKPTRQPDRKP